MNPNSPKAILSVALLAFVIAAAVLVLPKLIGVSLWWVIAPLGGVAAIVRLANWRRRSTDLSLS